MTYWIAISIGIVLAFIVWCFVWHETGWKRGYRKGYGEGHAAGKLHADNWWYRSEAEVEQERQKIWKEGWP